MLTVGSLFSGIGGFDLGLERAGMQVKWQVEIDPYCLKVLEKHWPHVRRYTDIKTVDWRAVEPVDLICGGFPCQPVSVAGKRKGTADSRWLWPEFVRCISILRPHYILIENVPGLLTVGFGDVFGRVLSDLASLRYDAEWQVLSAAGFGAPHLRRRIWIVAYHSGQRSRLQPIFSKRQNQTDFIYDGEAKSVADASHDGQPWCGNTRAGRDGFENSGENVENPWSARSIGRSPQRQATQIGCNGAITRSSWWAVEPDVGRVAYGIPKRVDRLKGLGNAVVPQVVEWIGKRIMEVHNAV